MKRYLKKVVFCTKDQRWQIDGAGQGVLYIVDTGQGLNLIKNMGLPVIAWLHEGNRDQNLSAAAYAVESPQELDMDFYEKVYRREMGIPWDILETDRCLVREMVPEDADAFAKMYREPEISRYMKDFHDDTAGEAVYIRQYQQQYRFFEYGVWSIVLKETGEVIGRAGFSEGTDAEGPCLGYMIGVPWQRQGLAYEVCKAILDYAKDELEFETVQLLVENSNHISIGLAEKLGFVDCGKNDSDNNAKEENVNRSTDGCQVLRKVLHLK